MYSQTARHRIGIKYEPLTPIVYVYTKVPIVAREKNNPIYCGSIEEVFIPENGKKTFVLYGPEGL